MKKQSEWLRRWTPYIVSSKVEAVAQSAQFPKSPEHHTIRGFAGLQGIVPHPGWKIMG